MGLSRSSTGISASISANTQIKKKKTDTVIALVGNPNVGKSTVFNSLTGMKQHTGNWTGKTVTCAVGTYRTNERDYIFADLPGCYSLDSKSAEEEVARDFIYFGDPDKTVIVCDASCLERNFVLVMQIAEMTDNAVICVNLVDEAKKRGITVDGDKLSERLCIPVVLMSARNGKEASGLIPCLSVDPCTPYEVRYADYIENYISDVSAILIGTGITRKQARLYALRSLDSDKSFVSRLAAHLKISSENADMIGMMSDNLKYVHCSENENKIVDDISYAISKAAETVVNGCVSFGGKSGKDGKDRKIDRLLTGKYTAFPIMLFMMAVILWITIKGANYPSELLSRLFVRIENSANAILDYINAPTAVNSLLCEGVIRIVGWVVSVMLPPMAVFFPLFTVLEDIGYLPRVAFNLDRCFKKCATCGKQALTMCMGFGCNAAGVVGCRIIDSPRERMIAVLTNSFMPCNGRFPILIAVISMFFAASAGFSASVILCGVIIFAILVTLGVSKLLSMTLLKGVPSSFALELPPFRSPQLGKILIRSLFDRTVFVLGRAVAVAAPTGVLIWFLVNTFVGDVSLLTFLSSVLEPIGSIMGLDGVILLAFILGLPANEIVIPIILMCYMSGNGLVGYSSLSELKNILISNGWNAVTAVNMIIFTVFHWPCSTTLLTVKKETSSTKDMFLAAVIPTAVGFFLCCAVNLCFGWL